MASDSKFLFITQLRAIDCFNVFYEDAGVPIKLLFQGEGHIVTVELKNGEVYRGKLTTAEDTMNCQLREGSIQSVIESEVFLPCFIFIQLQ